MNFNLHLHVGWIEVLLTADPAMTRSVAIFNLVM